MKTVVYSMLFIVALTIGLVGIAFAVNWDNANAKGRAAINLRNKFNVFNNTHCKGFRTFESTLGVDLKGVTNNQAAVYVTNTTYASLANTSGLQSQVDDIKSIYVNNDIACEAIQDSVDAMPQ